MEDNPIHESRGYFNPDNIQDLDIDVEQVLLEEDKTKPIWERDYQLALNPGVTAEYLELSK